jgi:hypothetical protein
MNDELDELRRANPVNGDEACPPYQTVRERIRMKDMNMTRMRERLVVVLVCCGLAASVATMSVVRSSSSELPTIRLNESRGGAMSAAADSKMASWAGGKLVLEAGVEIPAGEADVWQIAEVTMRDVEKLAVRLGIDPEKNDIAETPEGNFQGKNLFVSANGTWSYWVDSWGADTAVSSAPCDVENTTECSVSEQPMPEPTPLAKNLPSTKEAVAIAAKLIGGEGIVVEESSRDDWSVQISATLDVADGVSLPAWGYVSVGDNSRVLGAGGVLGDVRRVGSYPTIAASEAVKRVTAWPMMMARGYGAETMSTIPGCENPCQSAVEGVATEPSDSAEATEYSVDPTVVSEPPVVDVFPTDGEVADVIAVKVYRSVLLVTDVEGRGWIVPAYSYETRDGVVYQAVALDDAQYDLDATTETSVMDTISEPAPGEGSQEKLVDDAVLKTVIGMSEADAVTYVLKQGFVARTVERDGESLAVTRDYSESRVNFVVKSDKVVSASRG